ncbi:hypothetical protein UFOVP1307_208 [uncultured Caudovirales phage]|uniref:Uncharacterized protein n=1 Tax=uncultured Caudovirales phage TaxID=2100421 RepID=A0A6J5N8Q7_9CAUD|nr:hypothetical protein UFOVP651_138 [uncultured Caudovirales phage]CAB4171156.1 hypothetical protein UFOVP902_217 [uncultured Caudovirales phage]CAB4198676.1 hypothetical protein UFOVP1307_208 [uncultured Caudovirales phage]
MSNPTLIAGTQFNAPFNILPDTIYINPSTVGTQFNAPFNILPDESYRYKNPTSKPNPQFNAPFDIPDSKPGIVYNNPAAAIVPPTASQAANWFAPQFGNLSLISTGSAVANWKAPQSSSTNINLASSAEKLFNFAGLSLGSATGVPQISQLVDNLTNQFPKDKLSGTYSTLDLGQLRKIPGVEYADFRSRYNIDSVGSATLQRRLDGTSAGLRGSGIARAYAVATLTPAGAYSIINLNTKYGWGFHDAVGAIRSDFTARSHVAKQWLPGIDITAEQAKMLAIATGNYDEKKSYTATNTGKWIKTKKILEKATPFRGDRVSVIDFSKRTISHAYEWNPVFPEQQGPIIGKLINKAGITQDFIKFYMTGPKLVNGDALATDDIIVFRATLGSLSDSFQGNWTPITMIGRADPNYQYTGFNRDVSLDFTVYATDRDELQPIWRKLNALAGYTAPTYLPDSIAMQAPWMRITVGDLFVQQPVLLTTLDYTLHDADTSWEINIENDPTMMEVPFKVTVRCSFTMISDYLPQKGGRFYTLAKKFDTAGTAIRGNNNWLSDALDNVAAIPSAKDLAREERRNQRKSKIKGRTA